MSGQRRGRSRWKAVLRARSGAENTDRGWLRLDPRARFLHRAYPRSADHRPRDAASWREYASPARGDIQGVRSNARGRLARGPATSGAAEFERSRRLASGTLAAGPVEDGEYEATGDADHHGADDRADIGLGR